MVAKKKFSPQYIDALTECISGGSAFRNEPPIGIYRSGSELAEFIQSLGYNITHGAVTHGFYSRVSFLKSFLTNINSKKDGFRQIVNITIRCLDPRDYPNHEDKLEDVLEYLNKYLKYDGLEITRKGTKYSVVKLGGVTSITEVFEKKARYLSMPSVSADFERAISCIDSDPEGAMTSACSTLESVAKSILDGLGEPYPKDKSIQPLVKATLKALKLAPEQDAEVEIKRIIGGLANIPAGIGVLRTKYGDAHGRGKKTYRLSPRHIRLSVNAVSTIGLFLLETYLEEKAKNNT